MIFMGSIIPITSSQYYSLVKLTTEREKNKHEKPPSLSDTLKDNFYSSSEGQRFSNLIYYNTLVHFQGASI